LLRIGAILTVVRVIDALTAIVPVFLASVVECVEAWTVVVAVGLTRGWRAPLLGVVAAIATIGVLVAVFGVSLVDRIDEHVFEVVIGTLLLLFGVRWMRKSMLRSLGVIPPHDEAAAFRTTIDQLRKGHVAARFDWAGFAIAGKAMLLEGLEITFLVITLGASGDATYPVAIAGAALAFVTVGVAGWVARGPLSAVPENTLKGFVSVMLTTFGTYWVAEGLGTDWAGGSWALLYLFAFWSAFMVLVVRVLRPRAAVGVPERSGTVT
jgi:uncharacterized membrane protein